MAKAKICLSEISATFYIPLEIDSKSHTLAVNAIIVGGQETSTIDFMDLPEEYKDTVEEVLKANFNEITSNKRALKDIEIDIEPTQQLSANT